MNRLVAISLVCTAAVVSCRPILAQAAAATKDQAGAAVQFVRSAAVQALNFEQGNLKSLLDAQDDFTPNGWKDFMSHMKGYVDDKGVPQFSQSFVPSGEPVVIDGQGGIVHLAFKGKLKQTHDTSSTTYDHVEIDIRVGGTPMKIQHLEPSIVLLRSK